MEKSSKLVSVPWKYEVSALSACSRRITFGKNINKRIACIQYPSMLLRVPHIKKKINTKSKNKTTTKTKAQNTTLTHMHTHKKKEEKHTYTQKNPNKKIIHTSEFNTDLTKSQIFGRLFADAVELSIQTDTQSGSNVTSPHYVNS